MLCRNWGGVRGAVVWYVLWVHQLRRLIVPQIGCQLGRVNPQGEPGALVAHLRQRQHLYLLP